MIQDGHHVVIPKHEAVRHLWSLPEFIGIEVRLDSQAVENPETREETRTRARKHTHRDFPRDRERGRVRERGGEEGGSASE